LRISPVSKYGCRSAAASLPALALVALLCACASLALRDPVPQMLVTESRARGIDHARWWGDEAPSDVAAEIRRNLRGVTKLAESPPKKGRPVVNYLALSSGGDDGAFAAGVLVGWTRSGRRPRFEIETGVSAGALIAPFAFLGPAYDTKISSQYGPGIPALIYSRHSRSLCCWEAMLWATVSRSRS
jgi:hypothetical protein